MIETFPHVYITTAVLAVVLTLVANYFLQTRLITINNKEKAVDFLLKILSDLESLYSEYWSNNKHDNDCSLKIRVKQTQFSDSLDFIHKKYPLKNKYPEIDTNFLMLITKTTNEDFDSKERESSRPKKVVAMSKLSNKVAMALLKNKI